MTATWERPQYVLPLPRDPEGVALTPLIGLFPNLLVLLSEVPLQSGPAHSLTLQPHLRLPVRAAG